MYTADERFSLAPRHRVRQSSFPALKERLGRCRMARPPSIQWYYKQWLGDNKVLAMDWDARAMHFHLLMISIQEEPPGSLPNDMAVICRWLSSPSDGVWRRVRPQIFTAWDIRGNRWFNSGMVETCERQKRYRERYESTKKEGNYNEDEIERNYKVQSSLFGEENGINVTESFVEEVGHLYPANRHLEKKPIPKAQREAIAEAIERDGKDTVFAGTKSLADRVVTWPVSERRFLPNAIRFYNESEYLKDPMVWDRKKANATQKCLVHPNSSLTQEGACWECCSSKYISECEPA